MSGGGLPGAHAGPGRILRTARLMLLPPGQENLADLIRLKADVRVFDLMLHGVRTPDRTREELEDDIDFWAVRGYGTWCVFLRDAGDFLGICGLMERPDGRGVALRYALWPECRGHGYAREAARAALDFGHRAGLPRIIAVARDSNIASVEVLTDIGMTPAGEFQNQGNRMLVFESRGPAIR
ncbi:GNAT family N-acetyltransferase [Roseomonas hellenica]|uniref:GNAT family N-acetyltransferase n=1 Tax=Plastoroseomonas hellenica TaxID=2687306 RepID=A0ABS5F1L2_9PROT|nr:GNAT family N-acetyltransferase [Plastoroseomonas hellenica]MBR0643675.1 GNAT family N-acetyltransferase [Plastoroseomonas hellenica]MBR0666368.1 GNAT family N-acetyltransferase [Plastoroseomonas hellenica]